MPPHDISKLIVRTAMRDRLAFDLLYQQTSAKLFGVCLRIVNDRSDAEEVLQEVFVKIWVKAGSFAVSELSPLSWLTAIARNQAIDCIRARGKPMADYDAVIEKEADSAPNPEDMAVATGERGHINRCLEELETDRAAAIRGAYLTGESYDELAARYRVPLNTMRTWLRRGLLKLKECLER